MDKEIGKLIYETPRKIRFYGIFLSAITLSIGIYIFINSNDFAFAVLFLFLCIVLTFSTLIGQAYPRLRIYEHGFTKPSRLSTYFSSLWPAPIFINEITGFRYNTKHGLIAFSLYNGKQVNIWTKSLKNKEVEILKDKVISQCKKITIDDD